MKKYSNIVSATEKAKPVLRFGNFSIFESIRYIPSKNSPGWKLQRSYRMLDSETGESEEEFTQAQRISCGTLNNICGWYVILWKYVFIYSKRSFPFVHAPGRYSELINAKPKHGVDGSYYINLNDEG